MKRSKYITGDKCFDALENGKTLIENRKGYTVYQNKEGEQVLSNPNRNRPYKFDQRYCWRILIKDVPSENRFVRMLKNIFWIR